MGYVTLSSASLIVRHLPQLSTGNGFGGVKAPHGQNFLEIDSHGTGGLDGIYQTLKTVMGQKYTVEFDVRSRDKDFDTDDETVYLMWNDELPSANGYRATNLGEWRTVSAIVEGTGEDRLVFRESTTTSNNRGPFIDNIKVLPMDRTTTSVLPNPNDCGKNNMVENCSFEANIVPDASMLRFEAATVPAWHSLNGDKLELSLIHI